MLKREDFNKKLSTITVFWNQNDFEDALVIVREILQEGTSEMRAEALLFGGIIRQDQGLLEESRKNWLDAIPQAGEGTYLLYLLQNNIGSSYREEHRIEEALYWYRMAILTCITGDEFSCDQALTSFLSLSNSKIFEADEVHIARAVEKSWRVLEIPGKPNLSNLPNAIANLSEGFSKLLAKTMVEDNEDENPRI